MGRLDDSEAITEHNQNRRKTYEENDGITACVGFDLLVCYVGDGGNGYWSKENVHCGNRH